MVKYPIRYRRKRYTIFRRIRKCQNPCRDYTEPIDVQKYPMPILEKKLPSWAGYRKEEI